MNKEEQEGNTMGLSLLILLAGLLCGVSYVTTSYVNHNIPDPSGRFHNLTLATLISVGLVLLVAMLYLFPTTP